MEASHVYVVDGFNRIRHEVTEWLPCSPCHLTFYHSVDAFFGDLTSQSLGCAIIDLPEPSDVAREWPRRIAAAGASVSLIISTERPSIPWVVDLMRQGVQSVLERPLTPKVLQTEVEYALVRSRRHWLSGQRVRTTQLRLSLLTPEEREVMHLVAAGKSNKLIQAQLNLSSRTIDRRRRSLLDKMCVNSFQELVALLAVMPAEESMTA